MDQIKGTGIAAITPFTSEGEIDYHGLEQFIEHAITGGIDYYVVLGTTGESAVLSAEEKKQLIAFTKEKINRRVPLVVGVGGNNTAQVIRDLDKLDSTGIDAILSVSPAYNKPTQEGIYEHYKSIASHTDLPIILYNVPGRTASNMTAETTLKLASNFENIVAIKEASGDLEQIMQIIKNKPKSFLVISGDDLLTLPIIALGGSGVISVLAQGVPEMYCKMVDQALEGQIENARNLHYSLMNLAQLIFQEGNPAGIKALLSNQGVCGSHVRLPLVEASSNLKSLIEKELEQITAGQVWVR